jgi:hypothetical protein
MSLRKNLNHITFFQKWFSETFFELIYFDLIQLLR